MNELEKEMRKLEELTQIEALISNRNKDRVLVINEKSLKGFVRRVKELYAEIAPPILN